MNSLTKIMLCCGLCCLAFPAIAQDKLSIAATPNPNLFPLFIALADDPTLPVEIVPIADGAQIDAVFAKGDADALLAMTYTAAKKVTSGQVADLRLVYVGLWQGFSEVTYQADHIKSFADLRGKGLIVAGPTGGGKNGGPDMIFQAALQRSGMSMADVSVCYLPVMEAVQLLKKHAPLNSNVHCDVSFNFPASGISLVEPAATGLIMQGMMPLSGASSMERGILMQSVFTGYQAWSPSQLPHGGLAVLGKVLDDSTQMPRVKKVLDAYKKAAQKMRVAKGFHAMRMAQTISAGIAKTYPDYGLELPAMVVMAAMQRGNLVFRGDATPAIKNDLQRFLTEVVGTAPPDSFYALQ
jgi:NMT1/THI5 like